MRSRSTSISAVGLGCVGIWALACALAGAQTEVYCTVTDVKVDKLSNATRVTINADGMIQGTYDRDDFQRRQGSYFLPRPTRALPFRLTNCRTRLGSFVDISAYPISHLSFSIPPESREGVGLDVRVVLYKRGYLDYIWLGQSGFGKWVPEPPGVSIERSRDGHSVIIMATSDRYREAEPQHDQAAPTETSVSVSVDGAGLVTVRALNSMLGEVLQAIADQTGLQITVRGGVNYRASMSVAHVPPDDLMRAIARAYGLSVRSVGGIYYVTEGLPTEVDSYWAAPTAAFRLHNIPADDAIELLPDFLLRYVRADPGQNALVATGPPQLLDKLDADLRAIDRPVPQIRLSATIVEEVTDGALDVATEGVFASGRHEFAASGDTGQLSYWIAGEHLQEFWVKVRALQEQGRVRTRVCPEVTVRSGDRGEVFLGRRQYFTFLRTVYGGGTVGQEVTLESADVGSRITAEPWSGDGKSITLKTLIQADTILTVDSQGLPLVATRSVGGTVRVDSGDTIVFGGLALASSSGRHRRAGPEDWPIVSEVGRGRHKAMEATRTLVLLTVRASYDVGDFAAPAQTDTEGGAK
jgi:hypothetical protein